MSEIIRITDLPIDANPLKTHVLAMVNITADTTVQSSIEQIAPTLLSVGAPIYTIQISATTFTGDSILVTGITANTITTNQISGATGQGVNIPDTFNQGLGTVANAPYQHVSGKYNTTGDTTSLTIIGCGTSDIDRADAFKVVPIIDNIATIQLDQVVSLNFSGDTDAGTYGVPVGGLYHDNGIIRIRLT
jgi:hypothetical protein